MVSSKELLIAGGLGIGLIYLVNNAGSLGVTNTGSTNVVQREVIENNIVESYEVREPSNALAQTNQEVNNDERSDASQKRGFFGNIIDSATSKPNVPTIFSEPQKPNVNPDRGERQTIREQLDTGNVLIDVPVSIATFPIDIVDSGSYVIAQDIRDPEENKNEFQQRAFNNLNMRGLAGEGTSFESPEDIPYRFPNRIIENGIDFVKDLFRGFN